MSLLSLHPEWLKASQQAEQWLLRLANARERAERGEWEQAYGIMNLVYRQAYTTPTPMILRECGEAWASTLAGEATLPRYGEEAFSSAHEAVAAICNRVFVKLLMPFGPPKGSPFTKKWEWPLEAKELLAEHGAVLDFDVSFLRLRMHRERAELMTRTAAKEMRE